MSRDKQAYIDEAALRAMQSIISNPIAVEAMGLEAMKEKVGHEAIFSRNAYKVALAMWEERERLKAEKKI